MQTTAPIPTTATEVLPNGNTAHYVVYGGTSYRSKLILRDGTVDDRSTPSAVISILEKVRSAKAPVPVVRIFYGSSDGVSWMDENDTVGRVGRSSGRTKIPLLVSSVKGFGSAILSHCVIRIDTTRRTLWQHPGFRLPELTLAVGDDLTLPYEVRDAAGSCVARFFTDTERQRWLAVMAGDIFPDPTMEAGAWSLD